MSRRLLALSLLALTWLACGEGEPHPNAGTVVDSVTPIPVLLERFRQGLAEPVALTRGAGSRDELVDRYVDALERRDSAALRALALTRAEFAWLYYPRIPESRPPYELQPGLMWSMIERTSARGLNGALRELGGRPLGFIAYTCEGERRHGPLTVWGPCLIRYAPGSADTTERALFGLIVARSGQFKFVTFANKL